jgi:lactoylglutathione lyase
MVAVVIALSHFGMCVSDLDRSLRFYCEGLGFEHYESHSIGSEFRVLMELDGDVALESRFIRLGGTSIELLQFASPATVGDGVRRPINKLGLTHLCLRVDDIGAVASRVREYGGTVLDDTRTTFGPELDFVYCTDPDGVRVELMRIPQA